MSKKPHTSCYPGKRVRVKLYSGIVLHDRFMDGNDRFIQLQRAGKIMVRDIDSFGLDKFHAAKVA